MPSYPYRAERAGSSPISSTLAYAASFALPASRATSPGSSTTNENAMSSVLSNNRHAQRNRQRYASGHKWDDAWDSGSDEEVPGSASTVNKGLVNAVPVPQPKTTPAQRSQQLAASGSTSSSASYISSTEPAPVNPSRNGHTNPSTSQNAPLAILTRSFSYTHISPPSPSSYDTKSNGFLPPKAEWQVLETGEIVEAEQSYSSGEASKTGMHGFGNDWVPEKKKSDVKSPSVTAASLMSSALGFGGSRWKGKDRETIKGQDMPGRSMPEEKQKSRDKVGKEALRSDADDIVRNPLHTLLAGQTSIPSTLGTEKDPTSPGSVTPTADVGLARSPFAMQAEKVTPSMGRTRSGSIRTERKRERFIKVLRGRGTGGVDPGDLRKAAWAGIPEELRPIAWQMLLNYLPLPIQPRLTTLQRKRKEYAHLVNQAFGRGMTTMDAQIWHQIEIDVPRTRPGAPLWSCEVTQRSLERILYVWAIRHPASGYVQGINDLVTPFFEVFLGAYVDCDPELFDTTQLPPNILAAIEADSFWCLSKLLDGIQDNYISAQPGIHRQVRRMTELVSRIDAPLACHLEEQGVEYMQFAFRWMNCLLMREISVKCTIRMWDTYLSEGGDAFSQFHLYVCSAFLVKWSDKLQKMDFQEIIMFLQRLPTDRWEDHDVELLLSEAFVLKSVWHGAENHFNGNAEGPLGGGMGGR